MVTSSYATPRCSATICAMVVSMLWPCDVVPRYAMTRPLVSTLTVAASVASVLPPIDVGST